MKKSFVKWLTIVAAVCFVTSCDKDEGNNGSAVPAAPDNVSVVDGVADNQPKTVPFTIKAKTGGSLAKIGYNDEGGNGSVTPYFSTDDVKNLEMTIMEGSTTLGVLKLQDIDGSFSGDMDSPSGDGVDLTAIVTVAASGGDASSFTVDNENLVDLMKKCGHSYEGTFKYKEDKMVMLTDNKSYIEIFMSKCQHKLDVKINSESKTFAMNSKGEIWIAVDGGSKFSTNFIDEKTCKAGVINTINRRGLVDLNYDDGILWADHNIGGTNPEDFGDYFAWGEVIPYYAEGHAYDNPCNDWRSVEGRTFEYGYTSVSYSGFDGDNKGSNFVKYPTANNQVLFPEHDVASLSSNGKYFIPTEEDMFSLMYNTTAYPRTWVNDYEGVAGMVFYKKKDGDSPEYNYEEDAHIFLPAAGNRRGKNILDSDYGYYWTRTCCGTGSDALAWCMYFSSKSKGSEDSYYRQYGMPVRAIRYKAEKYNLNPTLEDDDVNEW